MKKRQGIVWAPVLIMVGAVVVVGIAAYMLIQAGNTNETENNNANVAVVNQASNTNTSTNTNSAANTNQTVNNNASANTNTVSNTNTATDPTAGWKTYTNSTIGFTVKFPASWNASFVSELGGYDSLTSPEVYTEDSIAPGAPIYLVNIFPFTDDIATLKLTNTSNVTINNLNGVRGTKDGIPYETNVVLREGSRGVRIAWPESRTNELVEQIVKTFLFTN